MQPKGNIIVDIGGGTTEIAVIALGGIICDKSIKIAGDVFTNDILYYMRTHHNLYIGEASAERIKIDVGAAMEELEEAPDDITVRGRDLLTGKPKEVRVTFREVARSLDKSIQRIEDAIMVTLSLTPPELVTIFIIRDCIWQVEEQCHVVLIKEYHRRLICQSILQKTL